MPTCKRYLTTVQHKMASPTRYRYRAISDDESRGMAKWRTAGDALSPRCYGSLPLHRPSDSVFEWLESQLTSPVISSVTTLATAVNQYWQQALLGLLARQESDDCPFAELIPILTTVANAQIVPLAADNRALSVYLAWSSARTKRANNQSKWNKWSKTPATDTPQTNLKSAVTGMDKNKRRHRIISLRAGQQHWDFYTRTRHRSTRTATRPQYWHMASLSSIHLQCRSPCWHWTAKLAYKVLRRWQRVWNVLSTKTPASAKYRNANGRSYKADSQSNRIRSKDIIMTNNPIENTIEQDASAISQDVMPADHANNINNANNANNANGMMMQLQYAAPSHVSLSTNEQSDPPSMWRCLRRCVAMPSAFMAKSKSRWCFETACLPCLTWSVAITAMCPKTAPLIQFFRQMRRASRNKNLFSAQRDYFTWLFNNDPLAFCLLDPIIQVHQEGVSFEGV